jgi:hypothetical protein
MNHGKSIESLLNKSKKDFDSLKKDYQTSLNQKEISDELKIDIKNIFENLRSGLDYMAHDIFDSLKTGKQPEILYFPIRSTRQEFDLVINKDFSGLQTSNLDVYSILESVQPYNDKWLGQFNRLNNNNKHQDLEEQTRSEVKEVKVSSLKGGSSVSWTSGGTFSGGVSVIGVPIDPKTQLPVPNNQVKTEVITWVSFHFKENGESVLPFIEKSIKSVEDIYTRLILHI